MRKLYGNIVGMFFVLFLVSCSQGIDSLDTNLDSTNAENEESAALDNSSMTLNNSSDHSTESSSVATSVAAETLSTTNDISNASLDESSIVANMSTNDSSNDIVETSSVVHVESSALSQVVESSMDESSTAESSASEPMSYANFTIQAESYTSDGGTDGVQKIYGDTVVGWFWNGDWMRFDAVDFGTRGVQQMTVRLSNGLRGSGFFDVRLDSAEGEIVAAVLPDPTGAWNNFTTQTVAIKPTTGVHNLYFVAHNNGADGVSNIDYMSFSEEPIVKTPKILFVGNSYTYYWEMPEMLEAIAESQGLILDITRSTLGGSWWDAHVINEGVLSAEFIASGNFDYVVLQNNSRSSLQPDRFLQYGAGLADLIVDAGASPLLYMTWGRLVYNDPAGIDQDTITVMYNTLGAQEGIPVVPVGAIWQQVRDADETLGNSLYHSDGTHPSIKGSYLIASIFYRALTGRSTADIPASFTIASTITDPQTLAAIDVNIDQGEADMMQSIIDAYDMGMSAPIE